MSEVKKCRDCEYFKDRDRPGFVDKEEKDEEIEAKIGKITVEEIGGRSFICVHSPDGDHITGYSIESYGKGWCIMEPRDDKAL